MGQNQKLKNVWVITMKKEKQPFVIAIAAVSGGGKTTVTSLLVEKLHYSKALYFDDYDFDGPDDILKWVENGADYSEFDLTPLVKDIEGLLAEPLNFIVLDYPFGYKQEQIKKYIDFAVFIDTPLDIAMARRIMRDYKNSSIESILLDMDVYLTNGRQAYLEMLKTIKPMSDFVIDGALSASEITNIIYEHIKAKLTE